MQRVTLPCEVHSRPTRTPSGEEHLTIYGEVLDTLEDADPDERDFLRRLCARTPHIRWVRAYSPIEPDGEYGDIDVRTIWTKLTREQFELARSRGWPQGPSSTSLENPDEPTQRKRERRRERVTRRRTGAAGTRLRRSRSNEEALGVGPERTTNERIVTSPEETQKIMQRIIDEGVLPHAKALEKIWLNGDIAVVVFEWDDEADSDDGYPTLLEESRAGLRALGWRGEPVFALNRSRAKRLAAVSDPVTAAWLRRGTKRVGRMFLWVHAGTFLCNFESGKGWSFEPGSTDLERMN